jgi:hypothetical protein
MTTAKEFNEVWEKGEYRRGSTCQRLVPFLLQFIPRGSTINDYGSGTGRAEILLLEEGYSVNMVDFASSALEEPTRALIGNRLTYTVSPLESLPKGFPVAEWGICINVLMTVDPEKLDLIMKEMRRTCKNLIIEVYERADVRLGKDLTTVKGNADFWAQEMSKYWPYVEALPSPEHYGRYITIGRSDADHTV